MKQLEIEAETLQGELATRPLSAGVDTSNRLGWHTPRLSSAGAVVWVQIDLGSEFAIDTVALVAASGEADGHVGAGYGFPLRFRVEASQQANFSAPQMIADYTAADVPNPGALPFVIVAHGRRARYVRVTATQAWPRREDWIVALGEIIVLSGPRNVAVGQPVSTSTSSPALPAWDATNVNDGQSVLGPPVVPGASPTNGYLAVQETDQSKVKWVQVDLASEFDLEEVRLFPARPTDFVDTPGSGFPVRFKVEAAHEASFADAQLVFNSGEKAFPSPGENVVVFRAGGRRGRYVRVTVLELHNRGNANSFALAELEVWSGGRNVARGAAVSAFDQFENPAYPRWNPAFLVDGFNSRHPVQNWPEWIAGLARRREIEQRLTKLDALRVAGTDAILANVMQGGAGLLALLVSGLTVFWWRAREMRRRALEELRLRIARDLHDEIGSHLGSIGLLSEAARRHLTDADARTEFAEITRIASRTNESLRDIVWLLDARPLKLAEIAARMREATNSLAVGMEIEFSALLGDDNTACGLEFTRNLWLIFKEALHNAAKYSGARHVRIALTLMDGGLELRIADDGRGFREDEIEPGRGLHNMRQRTGQLKGTLTIDSVKGAGTTIVLKIPYP